MVNISQTNLNGDIHKQNIAQTNLNGDPLLSPLWELQPFGRKVIDPNCLTHHFLSATHDHIQLSKNKHDCTDDKKDNYNFSREIKKRMGSMFPIQAYCQVVASILHCKKLCHNHCACMLSAEAIASQHLISEQIILKIIKLNTW